MNIAIVTGASSGMGREAVIQIGDRFGKKKIQEIWVIARRSDRLEELRSQVPVPLRILPLDLTRENSLDVLKRELKERAPRVKILINAAGYGSLGNVGDSGLFEETGMVRLNCEALCGVTHVVLPFMTDHGRILLLASSAGFLPQPGFAVYAATKAFVISFGRALNRELKPRDIVVTSVCPGPVKTEFFDREGMAGDFPFYKKLVMADPKKVVKKALRDSMMGKEFSVYGLGMKGFFLLSKLLPHGLLLQLEERMSDSGQSKSGNETHEAKENARLNEKSEMTEKHGVNEKTKINPKAEALE